MHRKSVFIGLVLLALALTSGTFAFTYTSTGSTLTSEAADPVYTTVEEATPQPDWNSLLPIVTYEPLTIRPNAAGASTDCTQYPATGENWDKVVDVTPDDFSTYVYTESKFEQTDLYNLSNISSTLEITGITVYFRFIGSATAGPGQAKAAMYIDGSTYLGPMETETVNVWATRSYTWSVNPLTGVAWTEDEVNRLQAGVALTKPPGGGFVAATQIYVEVGFQVIISEGDVPPGNLYTVTPDTEYLGDMQVRIYLTNTESIMKAYSYLNIKLYVANSIEAGQSPNYQILSMDNGAAAFNIEGGSASSYTVQVIGGSYALVSADMGTWASGWSIEPEFFCEVSQR